MGKWIQCEHVVEFFECDPAGIVHNSKYFIWFEQARFRIAQEAKIMECIENNSDEEDSFYFPVINAECKFIKPIEMGKRVIIKTKLKKPKVAKFIFVHSVVDAITGVEYAKAETQVCVCSKKKGMVMHLSEELVQVIDNYMKG